MSESENKEDFCTACVAVPFAMAGAGMAGIGSTKDPKKHKKVRNFFLIVGVIITLISLVFGILYLRSCKDCR